jgi:hypothetical protein
MFSLSTLRSDHVVNLPIFLDDRPSIPRKIDNAKKCVILFFLHNPSRFSIGVFCLRSWSVSLSPGSRSRASLW